MRCSGQRSGRNWARWCKAAPHVGGPRGMEPRPEPDGTPAAPLHLLVSARRRSNQRYPVPGTLEGGGGSLRHRLRRAVHVSPRQLRSSRSKGQPSRAGSIAPLKQHGHAAWFSGVPAHHPNQWQPSPIRAAPPCVSSGQPAPPCHTQLAHQDAEWHSTRFQAACTESKNETSLCR